MSLVGRRTKVNEVRDFAVQLRVVDEVMRFVEQPRKWKLDFDQRLLLWGPRRRHRTGDYCFRKCSEIYTAVFWLRPRKCISPAQLMQQY
jgi:hypothetical protein